MASACVNSSAGRAFDWLSPRDSFTSEPDSNPNPKTISPASDPDPDFLDFEFRLHDPVAMLPADELFSGGKLVPLHLSKPSPALPKPSRREELIGSRSDIFAVSPKAPTCTGRWREILRMKRQKQTANPKPDPGLRNPNPRSSALKQLLHRKSSLADPNLTHPLLRESQPESLSLSLPSSTSSDDSDPKPNPNPTILLNRNPPRPAARGRTGRSPARRWAPPQPRCSSVDSPRMTASGKVVFQGLGRSSSSPSTFSGGGPAKTRYNGMRVINVPVPSKAGSVFGFLGPANIGGGAGNKGRN